MGIPEEPRMSVKETAVWLFNNRFSISQYEDLQEHRKKRLELWQKDGLQVVADEETRLIEFGDKVLVELEILYRFI